MKKNNPTPKKPTARLTLSMREFSFFGKDNDAVITELKTILDSGHYLSLYMTQSTALSNDLFILDTRLSLDYGMNTRFRTDEYEKAQVIVHLQKEVIA